MDNLTTLLWILAPFVLAGVFLLYVGLRNSQRAHASSQWLRTEGKLLSSEITNSKLKNRITFYPLVEYEYTVAGTRYISDQISFGHHGYDTEAEASSLVEQIGSGNPNHLQVYYDPGNPKQAILIQGEARGSRMLTIFGAVLIFIPVIAAIVVIWSR